MAPRPYTSEATVGGSPSSTSGAVNAGEAVIVAPMQYSQIIWATLYGTLFFNEQIDAPTALGAAIVIASGSYIVLREGRAGASRNRPVSRTRLRPDTGIAPRTSTLLRLARIDPAPDAAIPAAPAGEKPQGG